MNFTGMKVFSATKARERDGLGERVTKWLKENSDLNVVDKEVLQSSDREFHCLSIIIWFKNGKR